MAGMAWVQSQGVATQGVVWRSLDLISTMSSLRSLSLQRHFDHRTLRRPQLGSIACYAFEALSILAVVRLYLLRPS